MRRGEEKELAARREGEPNWNGLFRSRNGTRRAPLAVLLAATASCAAGCAGGSNGGAAPSPVPPAAPPVSVSVAPPSASVILGDSVAFSATVTGAANTSVTWSVNGVPGGSSAMGVVSASGMYQAPAILPSAATVQVQATSEAGTVTANAAVRVTSDVRVQVTPATASLGPGGTQIFAATISSAGHPSAAVTWSLSGPGCTGTACGTIAADGTFTAPAALPSPPKVTVSATSVADPMKVASASVQIAAGAPPSLAISPIGASALLEHTQQFTASFTGTPAQTVIWSVNGVPGGSTATGAISNSPTQSGLFLAPVNMPPSRQVTISAASTGTPSLSASVSLALTSSITVTISPTSATRVLGARQTFSASVTQTSNPQLSWSVNGVPNGSASFGLICVAGSSPCQQPPLASSSPSVDYLAPASAPVSPQVIVAAISVADPAQSAAASVTIVAQVSVGISPPAFTLPPGQIQTLTATVLGAADQDVTWDVGGSINGSVAGGLICLPASNPCQAPDGPFAGTVEYRAPLTPPVPNTVLVRATTEASPPALATASAAISTAPFITGLVPASVFSGAATPFGLRVTGVQFSASQSGPGSIILVNGSPRATVCPSATECDAKINPADVGSPGTLSVAIEDGSAPGGMGNAVALVIVAPQITTTAVSLTVAAPDAGGTDIYVVEPTLAGSNPPGQLALLEIGLVDPASGTCTLSAPPLVLPRPPSGSATFRLCAFGTALDQVAQTAFSTPATPDLTTANLETSPGGILMEFDAVLTATAAPGPRTLYLTTANLDEASLTAAVEVE